MLAHIGYYALLLAKCGGPNGRVFAFEPCPDNFTVLRENVALNGYCNVTLVPSAVMGRAGRVFLQRLDAEVLSSTATTAGDGGLEIEAVTLDDFATKNLGAETINFVKMDIEGAEAAALEGMRGVLRSHGPVMLIELHGFERQGEQHPAIRVLQEESYLFQYLGVGGAQAHILARPAAHR